MTPRRGDGRLVQVRTGTTTSVEKGKADGLAKMTKTTLK
jgi:hypothetical protein